MTMWRGASQAADGLPVPEPGWDNVVSRLGLSLIGRGRYRAAWPLP